MKYTFEYKKGKFNMTTHTYKNCSERSPKKHIFLVLSLLCAKLLNNSFKS